MARRIIILERTALPNGDTSLHYVYWHDVPAARQTFYANATFASAVKDGSVTNQELTALQNGSVTEVEHTAPFAAGQTAAQVEASLAAAWQAQQTAIANWNPWTIYGTSWDSGTSTWTVKTVA